VDSEEIYTITIAANVPIYNSVWCNLQKIRRAAENVAILKLRAQPCNNDKEKSDLCYTHLCCRKNKSTPVECAQATYIQHPNYECRQANPWHPVLMVRERGEQTAVSCHLEK
jgi:hypothetical protein